MFSLDHQQPGRGVSLPGLQFRTTRIDTGTSKFDLSLHLTEDGDRLEGYLEYSTELYDAGTAERLVGHYRTLLQAACSAPDAPVSQLPLLTVPERAQLAAFNDTRADRRVRTCLPHDKARGRTGKRKLPACGPHGAGGRTRASIASAAASARTRTASSSVAIA